jgi:bifunctional pyridoxal-dependent enzyme with beta-cystathionase and maltose regulon repressor activities
LSGLKQWFGEGAEGHRMSFATSEEVIYEAMDRIKTVLI